MSDTTTTNVLSAMVLSVKSLVKQMTDIGAKHTASNIAIKEGGASTYDSKKRAVMPNLAATSPKDKAFVEITSEYVYDSIRELLDTKVNLGHTLSEEEQVILETLQVTHRYFAAVELAQAPDKVLKAQEQLIQKQARADMLNTRYGNLA